MGSPQKMTHTQTAPLSLYVCFTPTFSLTATDMAQGCWVIVSPVEDGGLTVRTRGCEDQAFHASCRDAGPTAWALAELIKWQWKHGLRAVPEDRAPLSAFLSDERDAKPWATRRRLFERTLHVRELQGALTDMLRLQATFSLPLLVAV